MFTAFYLNGDQTEGREATYCKSSAKSSDRDRRSEWLMKCSLLFSIEVSAIKFDKIRHARQRTFYFIKAALLVVRVKSNQSMWRHQGRERDAGPRCAKLVLAPNAGARASP